MTCRHALSAPQRSKLRLPEDITTQALAFFHHLLPDSGNATLVSVTLQDTFLKPIFNGSRFVAAGGTSVSARDGRDAKGAPGRPIGQLGVPSATPKDIPAASTQLSSGSLSFPPK
ncbi:hypothetical protein EHS25_000884 [Saitozyma podzolica]|uniref:Uncharacterized protein n=1 Tax=Saitozyma podzolica TaxID=1890683 RepID=A0A427YXI9_9TREE|nr:hypothetical protein EHS25_000884 [Saitozyma podzolica]